VIHLQSPTPISDLVAFYLSMSLRRLEEAGFSLSLHSVSADAPAAVCIGLFRMKQQRGAFVLLSQAEPISGVPLGGGLVDHKFESRPLCV
jgi:hypothetical protein